jgi:predicted Zn-dependent protease
MKPVLLLACVLPLAAQQGINFYSIEKEIAVGNQLAAEFQRNTTAATDARLDQLGGALVPKASKFQYWFRAFEGGGHEAATFPGGWVFIPRPLLARDDRQLAAILAHAIAHIELRHATQLMTKGELAQIGMQVATMAGGANQAAPQISMGQTNLKRSFELAADLQAVQLLRNAGLDPASLIEYLRTLPADKTSVLSEFPPPGERIRAVEKAIADLPQ